jgi:cytochrome c oxidase subunit I
VISHFHYVVAPGTIFALFAGVYYWFPKATGKMMNEKLGKIHFWGSMICMNGVFHPMLIQGMAGMNRRLYDGGASYADQASIIDAGFYSHIASTMNLSLIMSVSAWVMGLFQLFFIWNLISSLKNGKASGRNPWNATTLEWAAPSPPPHGNFDELPTVYRAATEYSVPGAAKDFSPQFERGE